MSENKNEIEMYIFRYFKINFELSLLIEHHDASCAISDGQFFSFRKSEHVMFELPCIYSNLLFMKGK